MTAYLDSSVLMRWVLNEDGRIKNPDRFNHIIASELIQVECFRTLDRLRIENSLDDESMVTVSQALHKIFERIDLILLSRPILDRASRPFSTTVGTLDAIHLASAWLWSQSEREDLTFLTHDKQMARAAQTIGLEIEGI